MSAAVLLVDFGASRVKAVLWSISPSRLIAVRECPAPAFNLGQYGEVEIPTEQYWNALENTAGQLLDSQYNIEALWLCTEMHGIVIAATDAKPQADNKYISWRDERAIRPDESGFSTFDHCQHLASKFFSESAMRLRSGLPFLTIKHLSEKQLLPPAIRLFTLADWLIWRGGENNPAIHPSLAAGTGLFNPNINSWSLPLQQLAGLPQTVILSRVVPTGQPLGKISLLGKKIQVFGGIGDMQAAAVGAGFPADSKLIINLGTGSQVLCDCPHAPDGIELRPAVHGGSFSAITHIPSGRALNVFAAFFDECAVAGGGQPFFWRHFAALTTEEVLAAEDVIDMNVFAAAWRFQNGGVLSKILEGRFTPTLVLASLAKSWLTQYAMAIREIDPQNLQKAFLLSGGVSRRARFILPVLENLTQRKGIMASSQTGEETLDGLLVLAMDSYHGN